MEAKTGIEKSHKGTDYIIAGAVSGFVTRFLCQPLDVLKIRFQLQVEPIEKQDISKYHSIRQAFTLIVREESISALWKGHVPAQILSITYGMGQFYSYGTIITFSEKFQFYEKHKYIVQSFAGACAGGVGVVISFPFDTIRTRLVAQSRNHEVYQGILHSCRSIVKQESPKAFYYGLSPTLLQVVPHTSIQFTLYGICTDIFKNYFSNTNISFLNSMLAGSTAGFIAKTVMYPFDLIKKRLQIQGFQHGRVGFGAFFKCEGVISCVTVTLKKEGLRGLFKGMAPSLLKAVVTSALHFTIYEQTLLLLKFIQ